MIGDILEHLGFAEALEQLLGEKNANANALLPFCEFDQSLLSPYSFLHWFLRLKKGKMDFWVASFYGRFLSDKIASKAKPMIITTIMAMTAGTKYRLATDVGVAVGAAVVAGVSKALIVSDVEL